MLQQNASFDFMRLLRVIGFGFCCLHCLYRFNANVVEHDTGPILLLFRVVSSEAFNADNRKYANLFTPHGMKFFKQYLTFINIKLVIEVLQIYKASLNGQVA